MPCYSTSRTPHHTTAFQTHTNSPSNDTQSPQHTPPHHNSPQHRIEALATFLPPLPQPAKCTASAEAAMPHHYAGPAAVPQPLPPLPPPLSSSPMPRHAGSVATASSNPTCRRRAGGEAASGWGGQWTDRRSSHRTVQQLLGHALTHALRGARRSSRSSRVHRSPNLTLLANGSSRTHLT